MQTLALFAGFIGCLLDGIAVGVVSNIDACASGPYSPISSVATFPNPELSYSGNAARYYDAQACYFAYHKNKDDCYCVNAGESTCFFYSGPLPMTGCEKITTEWSDNLQAGVAFNVISTAIVFVLFCVICCTLCCPRLLGIPKLPDAISPSHPREKEAVDGDEEEIVMTNCDAADPQTDEVGL